MSLDDEELSSMIRRHASRHAAPESLRAGLLTQVALAEAAREALPERRWVSLHWPTAAASFAVGVACATAVLALWPNFEPRPSLDAELVAEHVRALQLGALAEVASSDRHTVKPWFQGRLDYAPPVFDLADEGFPLVGGRVERVRGAAVAALAYRRNQHVIDVFVWPAGTRQAPLASVQRGFNVLRWSDGAMQLWAVSDVERAELERFARLWQERAR